MKFVYPLLFLFAFKAIGQQPEWPRNSVSVGYYGNFLTNPGLMATWDIRLSDRSFPKKAIIRRRNRPTRYRTHRWLIGPYAGGYADPQSHGAVFGGLQWTYQRISGRGWSWRVSQGAGALTSFLPNVYDAIDPAAGSRTASITYFAPSLDFRLSKIRSENKHLRGVYLQVQSHFLVNYNAGLLPLPALGIGAYL